MNLLKWVRQSVCVCVSRERTLFQQHKRRLYTLISPDGQHRNQIDYILYSQRWRSSIQSAKTRPRADCDSDHELLIAKFRLKLKKVGKTTRPFKWKWKLLSCVWLFATPWTVHGIRQVRILAWVAFPFSKGSSQPRDRTQVSRIAGRFLTNWAIRKAWQ